MLLHLAIRNFVIVDELELDFDAGFTALTGETGAGKSILIDALALALGGRADAGDVRAGSERADVTAEFSIEGHAALQAWLREQALEGDGERLLMRRVVDRAGRSRAFLNGHPATLAQLREAGDALVDIHGQNAHQTLLRGEAQRRLLDVHAGLDGLAGEVAAAWREWQRHARARAEHDTQAAARNLERDQLQWQVDILRQLAPRTGEWEAIQTEHSRLTHAASLMEGAQASLLAISEGEGAATSALSEALSRLRPLLAYDSKLGETIALLESADVQLHEAAHGLRHYADRVELDPARLAQVESRVEALHGTGRKFRANPEDLPALLEEWSARLEQLDLASNLEALVKQEQEALLHYQELARKLTAGRRKAAARLSKDVTAAMTELAMGGAQFEVGLIGLADGSAGGNEQIEFAVAANAGGELRPLAKVASGGELSRISLAIQVITSKAAAVPTLIFDEVDAGIGGAVAEIVGRKLRALGEGRQVLCVTHLAQVAAQAGSQWSVSKGPGEGEGGPAAGVVSRVVKLDRKARVEELARMLGGMEITATTRKHASEMLARA
jgi:DNA repair protein RecN (Recombination protein N)